jgi:hypothetical protein
MAYLKIFFERDENRAALGTDAVSIFLELGETAVDSKVARVSMEEARRLAAPLAKSYVAPHGLEARDDLLGALALLPDARVLHLSRKISLSLSSSVRSRLAGHESDETYYGSRFDAARLDALDADTLFDLLIDAYTVERASVAFPDLPAPSLGLVAVLRFALARPYASLGAGDYPRAEDDFYLATHVAYVLSDYSRARLRAGDLGPILPYLRVQVAPALVARDAEAAAELADVFRQLGAGDTDPDVCGLTRFLLAAQHADGSWTRPDAEDAYDAIHPTWVAVHGLRERRFRADGVWTRRVRALLDAARAPPSR